MQLGWDVERRELHFGVRAVRGQFRLLWMIADAAGPNLQFARAARLRALAPLGKLGFAFWVSLRIQREQQRVPLRADISGIGQTVLDCRKESVVFDRGGAGLLKNTAYAVAKRDLRVQHQKIDQTAVP
ncbi:MAG TPA: hypothetical protein VN453_01100 [Feifaniaceae bacterium]|nr:hypothetical protein [Feifaniaceae bacterium]